LSDITHTTTDRALEGLRERERALETEAACLAARLSEVRDMIALLTSRHSRGRPRLAMRGVRGDEPLPPPAGLPEPPPDEAA
jgi:hypothetical protein